jgi:hypothetical protein
MVREDETALICDLAETYGILDWRALPLKTAAALSSGLRENSRIKMKIAGRTAQSDIILLAAVVDRLSLLVWAKTKDSEKGINRPESIAAKMLGIDKEEKKQYSVFRTPEEFEEARRRAINRGV